MLIPKPNKAQRKCPHCKGTRFVSMAIMGQVKKTPCLACRGTGVSGGNAGYLTK